MPRPLRLLILLALFGGLVPLPSAAQSPQLQLLSRFETNLFDEGAAEINAYDAATQRLFFVNAESNEVVVLDLSSPGAPVEEGRIDMSPFGAEANSVAVSNTGGPSNVVAVAVENATVTDPGTLVLFDSDLTVTASTVLDASNAQTVTAGALPDGAAVSPDGTVVVVANEGEPDGSVNPEGTVTVVAVGDPSDVVAATLTTTQLDFGSVSLPPDLRQVDATATPQEEIEPEYVTIAPDGATAYVTLQENNGLAVVDVSTPGAPSIAQVLLLGTKDHSVAGNGLDVSNDDQIDIATRTGLSGLYMPDAIAAFDVMSTTYLATANEGDARDEDVDVDALILDPSVFTAEGPFPDGDLEVSSVDGISSIERGLDGPIDAEQSTANTGTSPGDGTARLFVEQSAGSITSIQYEIVIEGLDLSGFVSGADGTADPADDVIGLHVHNAARGATGGIVFGIAGTASAPLTPTETDDADLTISADGDVVTFRGTWDVGEGTDPNTFASGASGILGAALDDDVELYLNVHTEGNPGGEIRGQLVAAPVYDQLFAYGARSFTLWDASTGAIVYDSGDVIEQKTAEIYPGNFNADNDENFSFDSRSDNKGPEPEAIAVATASDGNTYAFVGLERIGGVMVFDVSDPSNPSFVQYLNNRDFGVSDVEASVLGDGAVGDLGPESISFIPAADNTTSSDLVVVSNEISGSVSVFTFGSAPFTLQILHASDLEGSINAVGDDRSMMDPNRGDAPRFSGVVNTLRAEYANTLVVSSGDNVIPGPLFNAAGDGSLASVPNYEPSPGRADIFFMNEIGFSASALGNHEFDQGPDRLASLIESDDDYPGTTFPYLSANLDVTGDASLNGFVVPAGQSPQSNSITQSVVATVSGERVGLIGLTTDNLASVSAPGPDVTIDDMLADAVNAEAQALTSAGVNKIILISHLQQFSEERNLAGSLSDVDVIIAGGSDRLLADEEDISRDGGDALYGADTREDDYPLVETDADGDDVLIVSADGQYRYVGRLVVEFDANGDLVEQNISFGGTTYAYTDPTVSGAFSTEREDLLSLTGASTIDALLTDGTIDAEVEELAADIAGILGAKLANTFGTTAQFLNGVREEVRTEQTNFGDLTADANLVYAQAVSGQADVVGSIKNGGGIRAPIGEIDSDTGARLVPQAIPGIRDEGEVSQLDIEASLSFNNSLSVLTLTVEQIKEALENGVSALPEIDGKFPQIGGITFEFDPSYPVGQRVRQAQIEDDNGAATGGSVDEFVMDGQLQGDPARAYKIVTLGFLAGGGDDYDVFTEASSRVDLDEQGLADDLLGGDGIDGIGDPGREQDALAEYLVSLSGDYTNTDTDVANDDRIVNLPAQDGTRGLRAWINEFHYDNDGADVQEFVEIVVDSDLADLENLDVVLYNGTASQRSPYSTVPVSDFTQGDVLPEFGFTIYWYDYTTNGGSIQNGGPDGIALCYRGEVVSSGGAPLFVSYEGTFEAASGCAEGRTSVDVGVSEGSGTIAGTSVSLTNDGATYADLIAGGWEADVADTPGSLNTGQTALPVELARVSGTSDANGIVLSWQTLSETNNAGFRVDHRAPGAESFVEVATLQGAGTTTEATPYRFRLPGADPGLHTLRLRQIDLNGTQTVAAEVDVRVGLDGPYQLSEVYPNPIASRGQVDLLVRESQTVTAELYNVLGQRVATLFRGDVTPDKATPIRVAGDRLPSGLYFVRVQGESFRTLRKVLIVR